MMSTIRLFLLATLLLGGCTPRAERPNGAETLSPDPGDTSTAGPASTSATREPNLTYVAWARSGLPREAIRALRDAAGVEKVTVVTAGIAWARSFSAGNKPRPGYLVPLDVAFVSPRPYAAAIPKGEEIGRLTGKEAAIGQTAWRVRGQPKVPFTAVTDAETFEVVRVVPDETVGGHELATAAPPPEGWGRTYALVVPKDRDDDRLPAARAALRRSLGGEAFRFVRETPFLRSADTVNPLVLFKEAFEEFSARPAAGGALAIDPEWVERKIEERRVPILGTITCHRRFLDQLEAALAAVEQDHPHLLDPADFGGCYGPRLIRGGGAISSHAFGAAVDLNVSQNAQGQEPVFEDAFVHLMASLGLDWGGDWLLPDGMHFEWRHFLD